MVIFESFTGFSFFIAICIALLALIYIFDAQIRRWEDRIIGKIRAIARVLKNVER